MIGWKTIAAYKMFNWLKKKFKKKKKERDVSIRIVKPSREVKEVFLHHTASANPDYGYDEIYRDHSQLSYFDGHIGYHFFIDSVGDLHIGRPLEKAPQEQALHNSRTIAICVAGIKDTFTQKQFNVLKELCEAINIAYDGEIRFRGHKEVNATECPHYDYKKILELNSEGYTLIGLR
jgi:N-acetyl-anhydromuramyl-L-alanine amidase AmpD